MRVAPPFKLGLSNEERYSTRNVSPFALCPGHSRFPALRALLNDWTGSPREVQAERAELVAQLRRLGPAWGQLRGVLNEVEPGARFGPA
jgi:hypothetical protein